MRGTGASGSGTNGTNILTAMYDGLEMLFTVLLVLTSVAIAAFAGVVVWKLFAGQR